MKLKQILTVCLVSSSVFLNAAVTHLTVELKSGDKFNFLLAEKPVITFKGGELVVNANAQTAYSIADILNYHFTEGEQSGVELQQPDLLQLVAVDEQHIGVRNAEPGATISLCSATGVVLVAENANAEGVATLQLPQQKGVYILTTGKKSIKIVKNKHHL